jgi:hypothetical protein
MQFLFLYDDPFLKKLIRFLRVHIDWDNIKLTKNKIEAPSVFKLPQFLMQAHNMNFLENSFRGCRPITRR